MTAVQPFIRVGVGVVLASQLVVSLWQALLPRQFYDNFPTVALTPPYSEHLMRDFGFAGLAIAVVLAAAVAWPSARLTLVALVAYLAFAVPHLVFHLGHLAYFSAAETAFVLASVGGSVVLPAMLVIATGRVAAREKDAAARQ